MKIVDQNKLLLYLVTFFFVCLKSTMRATHVSLQYTIVIQRQRTTHRTLSFNWYIFLYTRTMHGTTMLSVCRFYFILFYILFSSFSVFLFS